MWVDSRQDTWTLPPRKLNLLVEFVEGCLTLPALTLNKLQKLLGKLNYLKQLDVAFVKVTTFISHQLTVYLQKHPLWYEVKPRHQVADVVLTPAARQDLLLVRALLKQLLDRQFPLEQLIWQPVAVCLYTDASGLASECVGGLVMVSPVRAFSYPLSVSLCASTAGHVDGVVLQHRTAVLELLPIWGGLLLFAPQVAHCRVELFVDNESAVLALKKGTSRDYCTALLVRLINYTASLLDVALVASHVKRRSSWPAVVADDLSHAHTASLRALDRFAIYSWVDSLRPLDLWTQNIAPEDPSQLFLSVLEYFQGFPAVSYLVNM